MYPNQQQYPPQPGYGGQFQHADYPPPHPAWQQPAQPGGYAPSPVQQQPPALPVMPTIIEPTGGGGGGEISPNPRNLIGYAVLAIPTSIDENAKGYGDVGIRPKVTLDFIVVNVAPDGSPLGPIEYGENMSRNVAEQRPACFRLDAFPAEFRGAWWSNSEVVKSLRDVLQAGPGNVTMGRFRIGDQGNRPPLLERMADNDPARIALLEAYQQRAANRDALRRSVGNGITEINGGPPQKTTPGQQQGMPPTPGSAYAQQYGQPAYQQAPAATPMGGQWPAQPGYGGPPPPPQPGGQVQYGPPPAQPGQQAPATGPVPPGWTPEAWAAAPPHIRQAYGQ